MKNISILGSTGSVGTNTISVIRRFPDRFCVKALTCATNTRLISEQIRMLKPDIAVVKDADRAKELAGLLTGDVRTEILFGEEGYLLAAGLDGVDIVVNALVGAAGLLPTLEAIEKRKDVALANKETLVMAGELVISSAKKNSVRVIPVDSEHSAIFQCLVGQRKKDLKKIFLTASGGPFLNRSRQEMKDVRPEDALAHPNWKMGRKISIDSATLMNKGLEFIEAKHLFDLEMEQIEVVIHHQSIIHSMAAFSDGSILAQMGTPDMRVPIAYALSFPERLDLDIPYPDFNAIGSLDFQKPDIERFKCLELAFSASRDGGTMPAVLNAANEEAVSAFLDGSIGFLDIEHVVFNVMSQHCCIKRPVVDEILKADRWARNSAKMIISQINRKRKS